jgi:hypothetical protein
MDRLNLGGRELLGANSWTRWPVIDCTLILPIPMVVTGRRQPENAALDSIAHVLCRSDKLSQAVVIPILNADCGNDDIQPNPYLETAAEPDRWGMNEMRFIEGHFVF